jgi:hypothetical protein
MNLTLTDASERSGVSTEQLLDWAARGIVIATGEGQDTLIDAASLDRTLARRADIDKAKAAFRSGDPLDRIAYLTGESREDIERLGGAD